MRARLNATVLVLLGVLSCGPLHADPVHAEKLAVLARPGPWPAADHLIVYQDQVWFSSAVKGVNHNSADVWRYSPSTGLSRFERYLFSQDAGRPVVHDGLLYWPFEDMRVGFGKGVVAVTNGREWKNLYLPSPEYMMHTHALIEWRGRLVAAMAGWHSVITASRDAGASWKTLVSDAPRKGRFHRYNDLAVLGDRLFAIHWEIDGVTMARFDQGRMVPLADWPPTRRISRLVRHQGALYAIVDLAAGGSRLWRIDASGHRPVAMDPPDLDLRALASDGERLWVATRSGDGGALWASKQGSVFTLEKRLAGGVAIDAIAAGVNRIYVSGAGTDGTAILWGPEGATAPERDFEPPGLPEPARADGPSLDVSQLVSGLKTALQEPQSYAGHGRLLRRKIFEILAQGPPEGFFGSLLSAEYPDFDVEVFGGQFSVPAREIAVWWLIHAMEQNEEAPIPLAYLSSPWRREANGPQKWFDPLLAAMRAIQLVGQNDRRTIDALVGRLDVGDPDWLQSQVTGTLSALTGQPHAHDRDAWKRWWEDARKAWPEWGTAAENPTDF